MSYLGDIRLGDTLDCKFCTVGTTGAPTTLAGSPVISAYPANSTTQLTAGITLTVDFDAVTGLHNVRVVASSGNGYATATNYALVITTGTVGGTSVVGYVVGEFSIEARSAVMPTTAARTLDVSAGGEAGVDWANVGSPTTANGLTGTTIATSQVVASVSGAVGSVTTVSDKTGYALSTAGYNAAADQVWDEVLSGHLTAGTTGAALNGAGSAGDPWGTALPGAYGAGTAGKILGTNLDAAISSRATPTNITAGVITTVSGNVSGNVVGTVGSVVGAVGSVAGSVAGNVGGSVGSVTGAVGSVTGNVNGNVVGSVATVTDLTVTANAEPTAPPASNASLAAKIAWLFALARNRITQTATTQLVKANDDATTIGSSTVADDGTTFSRTKFT